MVWCPTAERSFTGEREAELDAAEGEFLDAAFLCQIETGLWYFASPPGTPFPAAPEWQSVP